ncbi:MAG TPA: asparagine synthase (glutamine-hydrolyzing) [Cyanobacteria bacterium UBA8803]|nr:asparagine synthase (glutamine-hydrolyzing) [Cyanobacteria bacterium UBA9273]HBL57659.1 asparagine synthase (glutamine-hydrolyzing) [Cyanobacteria bacterium UBA8803]
MCGIAGILANSFAPVQLETLIQRMQTALQHRGPDDHGIYISTDGQAAIAHTRLAILDLSPAGHQPMATADGRYWITFNGEIYNFQKLRHHLETQGEQFHSQTDTEVILKLYQRFGADCVNHLRGMFALAIWDNREKTCFLARDPLGIKPLYYYHSGSTLIFASELRAILATGLPSIQPSIAGLYGYLVSGSVPEPHTLIEGIHCLPAGNWLSWQSGQLTQHQYWQIDFTSETISQPEAIAKVRTALIDSIQHHFISDVPVGIFLSGGIDSTAVVALSRQTQQGELRTYSIAFRETDWNEGQIARQVAEVFGTNHTEYQITASLGRELFPKFLATLDQPSIDGFNTFCVSRIARDDGTKVVLSGLGGDELFGGYPSFQKIPQMVHWGKQLQRLSQIRTQLGMGLEYWGRSTQLKRLGDFLQQPPTITAAYRSFRGIFSHQEASVIAHHYLPDLPLPTRSTDTSSPVSSLEDQVSLLEITRYMRDQLLRDSDVTSMAWGLELRVPLVDRVLVETISSIPSSIRLAPGKQLLIQAVPDLPEWVFNRPKQGFFFPFEQWIAGEWQDYFCNINCPKHIQLKPWYRRWSLAVLQYWWERVIA